MLVQLVFIVILVVHCSVQECNEITFRNIQIHIKQNDRQQIRQITGCISPQTLNNYKNLENIRIDKQNIPELKKAAVTNISDTFHITFKNNNIHTVRKGAFLNLPGLKQINIIENNLSVIEIGAFSDLPGLGLINLKKNKINFLEPNTFNNLPKLLTVELLNNKLEYFEKEWFKETPLLEYIDVSSNIITSIPRGAFNTLSSLQWIDMKLNRIQQVHRNAFDGLTNLIYLDLSHNNIEKFDVDLSSSRQLEELMISNNKITYVPTKVLKAVAPFIRIFLVLPNPIQCFCYEKLNQWGFNNNIKVGNYSTECINKNNPICVTVLDETTECIENIDHETNDALSRKFYASFDQNCEN